MPGPVVAILNTNPDTIELLEFAFTHAGFTVVSGYIRDIREGTLDLGAFMRQHDPEAIVWDIALPYDRQWQFFQQVRDSGVCGPRPIVLTTTNVQALTKVAGGGEVVYEIVGKPYDLNQLIHAVRSATHERRIPG